MTPSEYFWERLTDWFNKNGREYPWRKTKNPFHILIAEFLLQQTHVRKVQAVYEKIISQYPNAGDLANAELDEIKEIIRPIGLSYRAERLKKCSEIICREFNGSVPDDPDKLKNLPGVGEYIADAVLCYAFGKPTVPIDTNVIRLFCRYFGFKSDRSRPRTDKILAENIISCFNFKNTRVYNLAVLDFAGAVCTAKKPICTQCSLRCSCQAVAENTN